MLFKGTGLGPFYIQTTVVSKSMTQVKDCDADSIRSAAGRKEWLETEMFLDDEPGSGS